MIDKKGIVLSSLLMVALPFLLIFGVVVFTGAVLETIKLPLALIGGFIVFTIVPKYLRDKMDFSKNYSLIAGAIVGSLSALAIYKTSLLMVGILVGILVAILFFLDTYTQFDVFETINDLR